MRNCCCRGGEGAPSSGRIVSRFVAVAAAGVRWIVPVAALTLVPKCPACVAGYVLLLTGIGISVTAAAAVRWCVIGVCVAVLLVLCARSLRGVKKKAVGAGN